MLWKLFGSERRVQEALEQSVGYDISPNILRAAPANNDRPAAEQPALDLWRDYAIVVPEPAQEMNAKRARKKA